MLFHGGAASGRGLTGTKYSARSITKRHGYCSHGPIRVGFLNVKNRLKEIQIVDLKFDTLSPTLSSEGLMLILLWAAAQGWSSR